MYVFVYGTLKREEANYAILKSTRFVNVGVTVDPIYEMRQNGGYPYVFENKDDGRAVIGEVYDVSFNTLDKLDKLEGYPRHYTRKKTMIQLETNVYAECWIYMPANPDIMCMHLPLSPIVNDMCFEWHPKTKESQIHA